MGPRRCLWLTQAVKETFVLNTYLQLPFSPGVSTANSDLAKSKCYIDTHWGDRLASILNESLHWLIVWPVLVLGNFSKAPVTKIQLQGSRTTCIHLDNTSASREKPPFLALLICNACPWKANLKNRPWYGPMGTQKYEKAYGNGGLKPVQHWQNWNWLETSITPLNKKVCGVEPFVLNCMACLFNCSSVQEGMNVMCQNDSIVLVWYQWCLEPWESQEPTDFTKWVYTLIRSPERSTCVDCSVPYAMQYCKFSLESNQQHRLINRFISEQHSKL